MSGQVEPMAAWIYEGLWGVLTQWFCVPRTPPSLPSSNSQDVVSRKPSPKFVDYLKIQLWISLAVLGGVLVFGSIAMAVVGSWWFILIAVACLLMVAGLALIATLAIYLQYDTTWYVFSDRSMRLRRGIWLIRESTITFENIQNVKVTQGPLQRWFGIANVVVQTAGGGGGQHEASAGMGMHSGLIEGVADAAAIRDSILSRVRQVNSAGLGDELIEHRGGSTCWSPQHLELLRQIRDLTNQAAGQS